MAPRVMLIIPPDTSHNLKLTCVRFYLLNAHSVEKFSVVHGQVQTET